MRDDHDRQYWHSMAESSGDNGAGRNPLYIPQVFERSKWAVLARWIITLGACVGILAALHAGLIAGAARAMGLAS